MRDDTIRSNFQENEPGSRMAGTIATAVTRPISTLRACSRSGSAGSSRSRMRRIPLSHEATPGIREMAIADAVSQDISAEMEGKNSWPTFVQ